MAFADSGLSAGRAADGRPTQVLGESVARRPAVAAVGCEPSATLPFTGLDTMALVSAGVVLIAGGSALTVAARKRRSGSAS